MKTYQRYWLFQIPGVVMTSCVLAVGVSWFELPLWACAVILVLWVAKDAALYPFLKTSYETNVSTGTERLVGASGVVTQAIEPEGYVKIGIELWQARSVTVIAVGESVTVAAADAMVLVVEPLKHES